MGCRLPKINEVWAALTPSCSVAIFLTDCWLHEDREQGVWFLRIASVVGTEPGTLTGLSHPGSPCVGAAGQIAREVGLSKVSVRDPHTLLLCLGQLWRPRQEGEPRLRLTRGQDCGPGAPEARMEEGDLPALRKLVEMTAGGEIRRGSGGR